MKKTFLFATALAAGCALLLSCNNPGATSVTSSQTPASFDTGAATKAVDAGNQLVEEAIAKGDSVAAASGYTADAKFMGSNSPAIVGRKNIQSAFTGFIKGGVTKLAITTTALWGSADLIAEEGTYTLATAAGQQVDKGKYIVLWKQEDGKWKIFRDCSNSDLPVVAGK